MSTREYFAGRYAAQEARRSASPSAKPSSSTGALTPYERDVQSAVIRYLQLDRRVAWCHRMNVAQFTDERGHVIRCAFKGCSDIIGQLMDGRFLAVECKRPGERGTPDQLAFISNVNATNGVGFIASSIDDVIKALDRAHGR